MIKNFTVNIGGIIFHIDEDAFEALDSYIKNVRKHFSGTDTEEEVVSDIENRIAEMLKEMISENKIVITIKDVNEVIERMGQPFEISGEETTSSDASKQKNNQRRRLYRDPDHKVLGGVCGGIAAYFNLDPVWVRLAFAVAFFVFGSGPLVYIILWAVIPVAGTTAEKLEMRGEPVNISSIEKSIREEFESVKGKLNEIKEDAKKGKYKKYTNDLEGFLTKAVDFFIMLLTYFGKALAVLIGIIFIVVGVFLITGFVSSFISFDHGSFISSGGMSSFSFPFLLEGFFDSSHYLTLTITGLSLLIGIPLIMLIYNGIKLVFRFKIKAKIIGISAFTLWLAGLIICGIVALKIFEDFSHKVTATKKYSLKIPKQQNFRLLTSSDNEIDSIINPNNRYLLGVWNMASSKNGNILFGVPKFEITTSESDSIKITVFSAARGSSKAEAYSKAEKLIYEITHNDTAIFFSPYYRLPENEKWRGQEVKISVRIPENRTFILDKSMERLLLSASNYEDYWDLDIDGGKWSVGKKGLVSERKKDSINFQKYDSLVMPINQVKTAY